MANLSYYSWFPDQEQAEEQALAKLPVCECCRKPIQDDRYFVVNCTTLCERCLDRKYGYNTDDYVA